MAQLKIYFLNVGQGDSTYIEFTDSKQKVWRILIDCNEAKGGINVLSFLSDQMPGDEGEKELHLDYLIVTHPHSDHIRGIAQIGNDYTIGELWDSGHEPEKETAEGDLYKKYQAVKEKHEDVLMVDEDHKTSRTPLDICGGELQAHIFRPSQFIDAETRDAIHAECFCIKLTFNDLSVLFAGDSNKEAWEFITTYKPFTDEILKADVLHASHHGSRTFFKTSDTDEEPLEDGIRRVAPEYLVISVPKESPHGHPHDDAMEIYEKYVEKDNIFYTYNNSVILEADENGLLSIDYEDGSLQEKYEIGGDGDDGPDSGPDDKGKGGGGSSNSGGGATGGYTPRTQKSNPTGGRFGNRFA
jgi:competence protein ComEC